MHYNTSQFANAIEKKNETKIFASGRLQHQSEDGAD
jgi:hypothetical protein